MILQLLLYFILYICCIAACFTAGAFVSKFIPVRNISSPYILLFSYLLIGVVAIVSAFAIIYSAGATVFLITPLAFFVYWMKMKLDGAQALANPSTKAQGNPSGVGHPELVEGAAGVAPHSGASSPMQFSQIKAILPILFIVIIFSFLLGAIFTVNLHGYPFTVARGYDYSYYARLAEGLLLHSPENTWVPNNIFPDGYKSFIPYHYFDCWFSALMLNVPGVNAYLVYALVICPLYFFISVIGIISFFNKKLPVWSALAISLLLAGMGRIPFNFVHYLSSDGNDYLSATSWYGEPSLFFPNKLLLLFPFGIAFCLLIREKKYFDAQYALLFVAFTFISLLPAVAGTIVLLVFINVIIKLWPPPDSLWLLISVALFAGFFGLFYFFHGVNSPVSPAPQANLSGSQSLLVRWHILLLTPLQVLLVYFPPGIILVLLLVKNKIAEQYRFLLLFSFLVLTCGLFAWIALYGMINSIQFFGNCFAIINTVLIFIFASSISELISSPAISLKPLRWAALILLAIMLCYRWYLSVTDGFEQKEYFGGLYSSSYVTEVIHRSQSIPPYSVGVFFKDSVDYKTISDRYSIAYSLSLFNCLTNHLLGAVNISIYNLPLSVYPPEKKRELEFIHSNMFYAYHEMQKKNNPGQTIAQSQLQFITTHHIKYMVCTKNVTLPATLLSLAKDPVVDSESGERFYIFK